MKAFEDVANDAYNHQREQHEQRRLSDAPLSRARPPPGRLKSLFVAMIAFVRRGTIDHTNNTYRIWEVLVLLLVCWNAVFIPYWIGFAEGEPSREVDVFNDFVDVIFILGMPHRGRTVARCAASAV